ncbi:MAG: GcrA cell cycle regulator [Zymomonas sp.]|nr:MAG: GcrA cell cycle regulator [Zymomonas sp.]
MGWTEERVNLLIKLWSEGLSASQIAGQLGGVTRNAVIGKVHRLKLEGRTKTQAAVPEVVVAVKPKPTIAEQTLVETEVDIEVPAVRYAAVAQSAGRSMLRSVGGGNGSGLHGATALRMDPEIEVVVEEPPERVSGEVVPISRNLTLIQLSDRTCKWPLGDPLSAEFRFCGNGSNDASPYCQYHARIAFQPVSERRRAR